MKTLTLTLAMAVIALVGFAQSSAYACGTCGCSKVKAEKPACSKCAEAATHHAGKKKCTKCSKAKAHHKKAKCSMCEQAKAQGSKCTKCDKAKAYYDKKAKSGDVMTNGRMNPSSGNWNTGRTSDVYYNN